MKINKQVKNNLEGQDGNSIAILTTWRRQAIREGWDNIEIKYVLDKAAEGDYYHLLNVIQTYSY